MSNYINYEWYAKQFKDQRFEKKNYDMYKKFFEELNTPKNEKEPS